METDKKKKIGWIIAGLLITETVFNAMVTESKHPYLWETFDPFPFYEMVGDYKIHRITYINLIVLQTRWIMYAYLAYVLFENKALKITYLVLLLFWCANMIEWFLNYGQSRWVYRLGALAISIPIVIYLYGLNGKNNET